MAENNTNNSNAHLSPEDYETDSPGFPDSGSAPYPDTADMNAQASMPNNDYGISLPVAPEGGIPAYNGYPANDYGLTTPVAPEGGIPAYPGNTSWSNPPVILPVFPSCPGCVPCTNCNSSAVNAQVRFLNASTNTFPVNVTIDNTNYASNARFGTISQYNPLSDGFHTVTVRRASGLRTILLQQSFPFSAGQKYTLVLVDTAAGGLAMSQISDVGCTNMNYNTGCYRVANMSYSGSSYDVMLYSHDAVFRNVGFREVTSYKQAMAGSYQFYITGANTFSVIRELPIIVIGTLPSGNSYNEPLVSYQADISAGGRYTSYLLGNTWSDMGFRVLTVAD